MTGTTEDALIVSQAGENLLQRCRCEPRWAAQEITRLRFLEREAADLAKEDRERPTE